MGQVRERWFCLEMMPDGVLECWGKSSGSCFYRSDYIEIKIDTPTGICSLFHYSSSAVVAIGYYGEVGHSNTPFWAFQNNPLPGVTQGQVL